MELEIEKEIKIEIEIDMDIFRKPSHRIWWCFSGLLLFVNADIFVENLVNYELKL